MMFVLHALPVLLPSLYNAAPNVIENEDDDNIYLIDIQLNIL